MAKYSTPRQTATVTFTVPAHVQSWDVAQGLRDAAYRAGRDYGVTVSDITVVSLVAGERDVTITESEYVALLAASQDDATQGDEPATVAAE